MACCRLSFVLSILLLCLWCCHAEIHRAMPSQKMMDGGCVTSPRNPQACAGSKATKSQRSSEKFQSTEEKQTRQWIYSLIGSATVGLCGIFPLAVIPLEAGPALRKGKPASHLKLLLSFAVGSLLGDVFLHLLPEAWAHIPAGQEHSGHTTIGLWVLVGIIGFMTIEKIFDDEEDEEEDDEEEEEETISDETTEKVHSNGVAVSQTNGHIRLRNGTANGTANSTANGTANGVANGHAHDSKVEAKADHRKHGHHEHIKVSGYLNLLANCIDNFTHGLAVAGSFLVSTKVGVITLLAILMHEIPHEVGDFAILLRAGFDRWKAAKCQLLTASCGMLGAAVALMAESAEEAGHSTAWILPFTSGGFIYIALVTCVPDLLKEKNGWESAKQIFCILTGVASMFVVTVWFDAH